MLDQLPKERRKKIPLRVGLGFFLFLAFTFYAFLSPFLRIREVVVEIEPPELAFFVKDLESSLESLREDNYFKAKRELEAIRLKWEKKRIWEDFSLGLTYPSEVKLRATLKTPSYLLERTTKNGYEFVLLDKNFIPLFTMRYDDPDHDELMSYVANFSGLRLRVKGFQDLSSDEVARELKPLISDLRGIEEAFERESDLKLQLSNFLWDDERGILVLNVRFEGTPVRVIMGSPMFLEQKTRRVIVFFKVLSSLEGYKKRFLPDAKRGYIRALSRFIVLETF